MKIQKNLKKIFKEFKKNLKIILNQTMRQTTRDDRNYYYFGQSPQTCASLKQETKPQGTLICALLINAQLSYRDNVITAR